jgi:hypothetical protein
LAESLRLFYILWVVSLYEKIRAQKRNLGFIFRIADISPVQSSTIIAIVLLII